MFLGGFSEPSLTVLVPRAMGKADAAAFSRPRVSAGAVSPVPGPISPGSSKASPDSSREATDRGARWAAVHGVAEAPQLSSRAATACWRCASPASSHGPQGPARAGPSSVFPMLLPTPPTN